MTEPTVTRLFGGPGSGKTTALLDRVEGILEDDDADVRDVLVVSYTRAAAAEIRERLAERLDISPRSLQGNVCTMHAKAYELLDLSRGDVVGEDDKEEFCEEYGIEFEDQHGGAGRRTARSTTIGNKIIATSQWLQRTERDVADWYDVPFQWNVEEVRLPPEEDPNAQQGNMCASMDTRLVASKRGVARNRKMAVAVRATAHVAPINHFPSHNAFQTLLRSKLSPRV